MSKKQRKLAGRRAWLALGTVTACAAVSATGKAQTTVPENGGQNSNSSSQAQLPVQQFDIPAGPLDMALTQFAEITGMKISYSIPAETIPGFYTSGISGTYSIPQALLQLLNGTDLTCSLPEQGRINIGVNHSESISVTGLLTDSVAIATIPTPLLDTPQSITAIPKELLAQQGVSTLRDALRNSPGISLAAGEGATQGDNLTIRGFSAQNDIFLDGIRDTGNYYRDSFNYGGSACRVQTGRQRAQSKAPSRWRCSSLPARESFSGTPRKWTRQHVSKSLFFRSNLQERARDWNWHNVIGFWLATPLLIISLTGVIMAYPWANDLLYRLTGNPPPPHQTENAARDARSDAGQHHGRRNNVAAAVPDIESLLGMANQRLPGWLTLTLRLTPDAKELVLQVDRGDGGRPDLRTQITLGPANSLPPRVESFSSYNRGRQLRMWARFTHTGEAGGLAGETIALIASLGAATLMVTGFSLSIRRLRSWLSRKSA